MIKYIKNKTKNQKKKKTLYWFNRYRLHNTHDKQSDKVGDAPILSPPTKKLNQINRLIQERKKVENRYLIWIKIIISGMIIVISILLLHLLFPTF